MIKNHKEQQETIIQEDINDCWNKIGIWGKQLPRCEKLVEHVHCRNCHVYTDAGRKVLERGLTKEYEKDWASVYSQDKQEYINEQESLTIFRIGDELLALPTECIVSVNDVGNIHSIPHQVSPILRGLINLHGELKICISLGCLLELKQAVKEVEVMHRVYNRLIEISNNNQHFVFFVNEVLGIHDITDKELKDAPATISQSQGTFTKALIKWHDQDVAYLDIELIYYNLDKKLI